MVRLVWRHAHFSSPLPRLLHVHTLNFKMPSLGVDGGGVGDSGSRKAIAENLCLTLLFVWRMLFVS